MVLVDEVVDFLDGCSSSSSLFFVLVLASEGIAAADVNFLIANDNHAGGDLCGGVFEFHFHFLAVGDDLFASEEIQEESHVLQQSI